MNSQELFVIPEDLLIFPVSDLNHEMKERLRPYNNDFILSRKGSRVASFILGSESVDFLNYFRNPVTIVDAVLKYGLDRNLDPRKVLNESFPLIHRLQNAKFLVAANSLHNSKIEFSFKISEQVGNWKILERIQVSNDVEVYRVRLIGGSEGALKIAHKGLDQICKDIFKSEAKILSRINCPPAPVLLDFSTWEGRPYLLLEWCYGITVDEFARRLREPWNDESGKQLVNLAIVILEAFSDLHKKGIVHGDIHPKNILVTDDGRVRIIDFGQACTIQSKSLHPERREGVAYYYEPEYAKSLVNRTFHSGPSKLGEQYALGVLLYYLFTGKHYLNFSLETDLLLHQIINDNMLPFRDRGLDQWPEIESIISRVLSKNPTERFNSIRHLIVKLQKYKASENLQKYKLSNILINKYEPIENILVRYGVHSEFFATCSRSLSSPTCSVNYGSAGIAYFYYRMACIRDDAELLSTADLWATRALREIHDKNAFSSSDLGISESTVGKISLYHSPTGVHLVRALIFHAMGDISNLKKALNDFIVASKQPCQNLDLTLGMSSLLIGCSILLETFEDGNGLTNEIKILGKEILVNIWDQIKNYNKIGIAPELPYIGLAHGWAGIIYASLRWCWISKQDRPSTLQNRLNELVALVQTKGKIACWPLKLGSTESWPGWCHGSSGYIYLLLLAGSITGCSYYLDLALKAGQHIWEYSKLISNNEVVGQLCCGTAGQSYALLELYKYTNNKKWLRRAKVLGSISKKLTPSYHHTSNSLYRGDIGIALLLADLNNPRNSCMPMFETQKVSLTH
jgi:eukaryotic-like serine/threonine-protein kinase